MDPTIIAVAASFTAIAASFTAITGAEAIADAIKASGAIIRMEPSEFQKILSKSESPLIVTALSGVFSKKFLYLTNYKGLHFFCKSSTPIILPSDAEIVQSKKIYIPG